MLYTDQPALGRPTARSGNASYNQVTHILEHRQVRGVASLHFHLGTQLFKLTSNIHRTLLINF